MSCNRAIIFSSVVALAIMLTVGVAVQAAQLVETEEAISFTMPDGWSLSNFSERTGSALLVHGASGMKLLVERYGFAGKQDPYKNKTPLSGGRTLEWQYTTKLWPLLQGRVTLADAHILIGITSKDLKSAVPQEAGMAALRRIGETVKVLGPRKCIGGECKPGTVTEIK